MIYLDNAATSFPKPQGIFRELEFCLKTSCGNPGRSSHTLSLRASELIYSVRERLAHLFSFRHPEQVVFTYNATYALNLAIKTLVPKDCHIITTDMEHNSVIRPLEALCKSRSIKYTEISTEGDLLKELNSALRPETKGLVCSLCSNVIGRALPLSVLSKFARENSLFLIIDGSQAAGHMEINLTECPCDAFCAPGHKALFGIQGSGFVIFGDKERGESFIEGGSGSESLNTEMPRLLPEGYEAGTLSTPAIATLGAGVDFIGQVGITEIRKRLDMLTEALYERLTTIPGIRIYGRGSGILSFNLGKLPSSYVASRLDTHGICVRGGLHCAPGIHRRLGTCDRGAVRASFSYLNELSDVEELYLALLSIN